MKEKQRRSSKKKYFKLEYETVINVLETLTDAELGEYFKAICNYELYGEKPKEFSDRVVKSLFQQTARELDYQMQKHLERKEQGYKNKTGKDTLRSQLSVEQFNALDKELPSLEDLLDEIQSKLASSETEVKSPVNYIKKYAKETDWIRRFEQKAENMATGNL